MSDDQLAKLAVAREKALAVRRAQKVEKLKAEAARLEAPSEEAQSSVQPLNTVDALPPTPAPQGQCKDYSLPFHLEWSVR